MFTTSLEHMKIQQQLDLPFVEKRKAQLANGHIEEYDVVGPIVLKFKKQNKLLHK